MPDLEPAPAPPPPTSPPAPSSLSEESDDLTADAFAERIFGSLLGGLECLSVYVGDRMGWYRSLAENGPATSSELAERTGSNERYVREWLEQQAACGIVSTDATADDRCYVLPPAAAEVLTDTNSLAYVGPLARLLVGTARQMPSLLDAYRTGGGVSWAQFGDDAREAQAALNRPWFEHRLGAALSSVREVDAVLAREGARIADVGCGAGWSTLALARAYPNAMVEGIDVDPPSIEMARRNAAEAGLGDRVTFRLADGSSLGSDGSHDATFLFECLHDMPQPVDVLDAVRRATRPDGVVVVVDEAVADTFTAPADEVERVMYGFSLFVCLPDGMSSESSEATGTVMRRGTLEGYATRAGFKGVDVLPIEDFSLLRFYRLRQRPTT